ncbi:signal peptidase I [Pseudonocardia halophobica]|uniref:signal peptidase I n=1 Tax=Pseudonocardia halophobica TaxID=29401 RepID=UPI003D8ED17B
MASPELPDDRRAPSRRHGPTDPSDPRSGGGAPVGEVPARHVPGTGPAGAPFPGPQGGFDGRGPGGNGQPPSSGYVPSNGYPPQNGYGPESAQAPENANGFRNGQAPPNGQGPQFPGPAPYGGRRPPSNGLPQNGRPPSNGLLQNGERPFRPAGPPPAQSSPGFRPVGGPPDPRRGSPRRPLDDDRPTDVVGMPPVPAEADAEVTEETAPADATVEPQRRVDPSAAESDGVPGRHRRRAGATSGSHPASDYVPKRGPGGRKPRSGRRRRNTFWKELPLLVGVALVLTILIQAFLAKVYVIPSGSMETTLHGCTGCTNDRVLVDKVTYRFGDPQPGDVVVFRGPDSWVNTEFTVDEPTSTFGEVVQQFLSLIGLAPPDEKDFVKRVIAVGGQTVSCCDSRNRVMVDNQPLEEPYIYYLPEAGPARQIPFGPITVPQGELWVMGDSRNNSSDSRIDGHGPIPVDNVIGKARMKVLPVSRFGFIDSTNPQQSQATALGVAGDGAPLALGVLGVVPFWLLRRRSLLAAEEEFLPRRRRT